MHWQERQVAHELHPLREPDSAGCSVLPPVRNRCAFRAGRARASVRSACSRDSVRSTCSRVNAATLAAEDGGSVPESASAQYLRSTAAAISASDRPAVPELASGYASALWAVPAISDQSSAQRATPAASSAIWATPEFPSSQRAAPTPIFTVRTTPEQAPSASPQERQSARLDSACDRAFNRRVLPFPQS